MLNILLPLVLKLDIILSPLCVCCDAIFFSALEKLQSCCLIEISQSSCHYLKTYLIHENFVSSVIFIGLIEDIRWNLRERITYNSKKKLTINMQNLEVSNF